MKATFIYVYHAALRIISLPRHKMRLYHNNIKINQDGMR